MKAPVSIRRAPHGVNSEIYLFELVETPGAFARIFGLSWYVRPSAEMTLALIACATFLALLVW